MDVVPQLQALKYAVLDITQQLTEQHEREQGEVEERGNGHDSNRDTLQRTNDQLMMYKQEVVLLTSFLFPFLLACFYRNSYTPLLLSLLPFSFFICFAVFLSFFPMTNINLLFCQYKLSAICFCLCVSIYFRYVR